MAPKTRTKSTGTRSCVGTIRCGVQRPQRSADRNVFWHLQNSASSRRSHKEIFTKTTKTPYLNICHLLRERSSQCWSQHKAKNRFDCYNFFRGFLICLCPITNNDRACSVKQGTKPSVAVCPGAVSFPVIQSQVLVKTFLSTYHPNILQRFRPPDQHP